MTTIYSFKDGSRLEVLEPDCVMHQLSVNLVLRARITGNEGSDAHAYWALHCENFYKMRDDMAEAFRYADTPDIGWQRLRSEWNE